MKVTSHVLKFERRIVHEATVVDLVALPQRPFRASRLVVWEGAELLLMQVRIGNVDQLVSGGERGGDPLPLSMFTPEMLPITLALQSCGPGTPISVTVSNRTSGVVWARIELHGLAVEP